MDDNLVTRTLHRLSSSNALPAVLTRFSIVGGLTTLFYLIASNLLVITGMMVPTHASLTAYLCGMVLSYLGQKQFTFRVASGGALQVVRFLVLSAIGLAVSWFSVKLAVERFEVSYVWGTLATAVLVPALSFVVMKFWVFVERETEGG